MARLSCIENDGPDWELVASTNERYAIVTLDGEKRDDVIRADDQRGFIDVYTRPMLILRSGPLFHRLWGVVEIKWECA